MHRLVQLLWRIARHPRPYRATIADFAWRRMSAERPNPAYRHCVSAGAALAGALGESGITIVEFGVAGGNGLVALEQTAGAVENATGLRVDVVGFDSGVGMPVPDGYRDLPYKWGAGYYPMNEPALRARLKRARLLLGPVAETAPVFASECRFPVAAVMMDLDYYSSTLAALQILDAAPTLPRVSLYFDDLWAATPYTGEWGAINEYNRSHQMQKLVQTWDLAHADGWRAQVFELHKFEHPDYCRRLTTLDRDGQLPLADRHHAKS